MTDDYCKLQCPTGSENGKCECRGPRDCRHPAPPVPRNETREPRCGCYRCEAEGRLRELGLELAE